MKLGKGLRCTIFAGAFGQNFKLFQNSNNKFLKRKNISVYQVQEGIMIGVCYKKRWFQEASAKAEN